MSSLASLRISSFSASADFGEKVFCSGWRYFVCSGGSRLMGRAWAIRGVPGGMLAMIAFICSGLTNSLENVSGLR